MDHALLALLLKLAKGSYEDFFYLKNSSQKTIKDFLQKKYHLDIKLLMRQLDDAIADVDGCHLIHPCATCYPKAFHNIPEPPLLLFAKGEQQYLHSHSVSVIGSREPSFNFLEWMDVHLQGFLKKRSVTVVSGGARGIDQKASQVALRAKVPTIIFLPSGFQALYPGTLTGLFSNPNILWVSEYLPREPMRKFHFYKRNRLIAALGKSLLAVQLSLKSGSMITVKYAIEMGREVWTLPDFPGNRHSAGNLLILKDGGTFVTDANDLITAWDRNSF